MRADTLTPEQLHVVNGMVLDGKLGGHDFMAPTFGNGDHTYPFDTGSYAARSVRVVAHGYLCARHHSYAGFSQDAIFQQLADQWRIERGASSSITQIAMCRSYQRIIGMGREMAVPLILADLQRRKDDPDHWFWALQMLTGDDPVPDDARGDMPAMARAWLDWGRAHGYAS